MFSRGVIAKLELRRSEDALKKADIAVGHAHSLANRAVAARESAEGRF